MTKYPTPTIVDIETPILDLVNDKQAWLAFVRDTLEPEVRRMAVDDASAEIMLARLRGETDE